jgi:hypothetical protein
MEFNKKASIIDLKKTDDALRQLIQMIANLDSRLQRLENADRS